MYIKIGTYVCIPMYSMYVYTLLLRAYILVFSPFCLFIIYVCTYIFTLPFTFSPSLPLSTFLSYRADSHQGLTLIVRDRSFFNWEESSRSESLWTISDGIKLLSSCCSSSGGGGGIPKHGRNDAFELGRWAEVKEDDSRERRNGRKKSRREKV